MKKEKRNGIISLWKFLFAIVIAFFHTNQFYDNQKSIFFYGGYIAVEFFFIISGFYLAQKSLSEKYDNSKITKESIKFILNKLKKIMPYILIAYTFSLIVTLIYNPLLKPNEIINSIWNLLLLRELGFKSIIILPQLWYLTSLFVSMFVLYPLAKKYKEKFIVFISPLIILFGLGYLNHNWTSLNHAYQIWNGFIYTGMLRGFIELNIGMLLCLIHYKLSNIEYTKIGKTILTILGEGLLICVLIIINYISAPKHYDYIMLLFISIAVLIIASEKTYEYKILSNNLFYYLEKLSMPIFINHVLIINCVDNISPLNTLQPINQSIISVVLTIIFSITELKVMEIIKNKKIGYKIKKIFIKC